MKRIPFLVVLILLVLNFFGAWTKTFPLPTPVGCVYKLAEFDAPAADVLLIGGSRVGQGIDPGYMQDRLKNEFDKSIVIERLQLNFPDVTQFIPLAERYLGERGAPKYAFIQLLYNFKAERHRTWDIPVNMPRNVAFEKISKVMDLRDSASLNDYGTALSRTYERGYRSDLEILLLKIELNVLSAIKFPSVVLKGEFARCKGDIMHRHQNPKAVYNTLSDEISFSAETDKQIKARERNTGIAAEFMPLDLLNRNRVFENTQMQRLVDMFEVSGTTVILMTMPALGSTHISESTLNDIETVFPRIEFVHPYSLFESEVGDQLAVSFVDTHHPNRFGALQYSRFYAEYINTLEF
jgi:hypothetical protein